MTDSNIGEFDGWTHFTKTGERPPIVVNVLLVSSENCIGKNSLLNMSRTNPNILVTGTPGVGKSKLAEMLKSKLGLEVINVGHFAKEHNCLGDWDPEYQSHELKEDDLLDLMEERLGKGDGGIIVEHHVPEADKSDLSGNS